MTTWPGPEGPDIAIVGAVRSEEEGRQLHEMRFVLEWALRAQGAAHGPRRSRPPR